MTECLETKNIEELVEKYYVIFYWPTDDTHLFYSFDTLEEVLYQKEIYPSAKCTIIKGIEIDAGKKWLTRLDTTGE